MAPAVEMTPDERAAFDKVHRNIRTLDPADPNRPVQATEVKGLIEQV